MLWIYIPADLANIIDSKKIKEIKDLNARIISIRGARNKFAHYCWSRWDDKAIFGAKMGGQVPKHNKPNKDSRKIKIQKWRKYTRLLTTLLKT